MAQAKENKFYRTFVKGLITEASYLTYPEDSSLDELNTIPSRKGNRIRRLGFNYNLGNLVPRSYSGKQVQGEFTWNAVAGDSSISFLVVQNGPSVSFFDRSIAAFSDSLKSFIINLSAYCRPGISDASYTRCKFASGKGYLFIVGADIEPLVVSYNKETDTFSVTKIAILARDFEGVNDGLANDAEPTELSIAHYYNLLNQGWVSPNTG
jgi:hypothetical protein